MRIRTEGEDLPGRRCGPSPERPSGHDNIQVGVQRRNDPHQWLDLQPGDAATVAWEFEATAIERDGRIDGLGPWIQGGPGTRFVYLSWGTVGDSGGFEMFRRAKLLIADIDDATLRAAARSGVLVGRLGLTDAKGNPSCARQRDVRWSVRPVAAP
ncbi:MAG TPA: DUF5990 family protein [Jatrophihabitans sp.]|jgi:hypothetical protein|uniref:DUF5990 family protein n=1 Tax=Jatrophihabitans sp. TaxID=1932789 RepID=UPI002DFC1674|nr:DUF5990 family protein [Jatrophihabitans sp.]